MRQVLFRITLDGSVNLGPLGEIPLFGFGLVLLIWTLFNGGLLWFSRQNKSDEEKSSILRSTLVTWAIGSVVIFLLPNFASRIPQGIPVFGYGFMVMLGILAGGWTAGRRAESVGIPKQVMWDTAFAVVFMGIVGARLFFVVQYSESVFQGVNSLPGYFFALVNLPDGGLVLYGGLIAGTLTFFARCYLKGYSPRLIADIAAPSMLLGMAFGRIGCLFNGCCWGDRCTLPWAITFPQNSVPYMSLVKRGFLSPEALQTIPLHPSQIYSSVNALILSVLAAAYFHRRAKDGQVTLLVLIIYPITRFLIEFIRGDEMGQFDTSMTISQWVSLLIVAIGIVYGIWLSKQPPQLTRHVNQPTPPGTGSAKAAKT
ncbi:Prolipoprotein diacylglyceryl transferase [Polystyrenella longa]|uniref:Phosphatidylglycerol--prolipoprotein diacylglyceryl transferase n=1 Tax=Polystyrenella longa TaxID=2528007 RepID=A0A518CK07_9PLAN|nr:prolipoprotein diacylglyceryl transferase [Polystyrenella longa]QDU79547.1 Prolipoprotein diacylglyceryl transferase [Polystyrenella longa]